MMAGNPSWWSMYPPLQQQPSALLSSSFVPSHQYVLGSSSSSTSSSLPFNSLSDSQELPQSWSQLLFGGLSSGDEDKFVLSHHHHFHPKSKLESWEEDQILSPSPRGVPIAIIGDVKQEVSQNISSLYSRGDDEFQHPAAAAAWTQHQQVATVMPVSSPRSSCVASLSTTANSILDFSYNTSKADGSGRTNNHQQPPDHSSECNSPATGGACKKARVQPSSSQPPLKVRKEKLGDRITALHQLVSPFGKTDTASVLLEAIGYIRFLQSQIEALSSPYLGTASANSRNPHLSSQDKPKDLRSRGLCLVPVSCTQNVGSDNGADYWAPAIGSGF